MHSVERGDTDKRFSFSEDERQRWQEIIKQFFQSGFSIRRTGFPKIVVDAIETLKLGG